MSASATTAVGLIGPGIQGASMALAPAEDTAEDAAVDPHGRASGNRGLDTLGG
ncbi:hypothetical protein ACPXCP_10030 [Streptomyces sp. DT20]|uniref:hypothetical protein n=1 Tax=unclassified Streptomyces TaxID=2593676 RepID=UPI002E1066FB|nr:hypothetical protein OG384_35250 [Streptomyces sp. NBC_01324]